MEIVDVKEFANLPDGTRAFIWRTISASVARRKADPRIRCPECKGPVGLYAASDNKRMPERAEHLPANNGCSLGHSFDGNPRMSPLAIDPNEPSYKD